MIYVDTSVIVAALDPIDPRRFKARRALEVSDNKVVSELVITELASVLSRQSEVLSDIKNKLGVNESITLLAAILYVLKRFDLRYVSAREYLKTPIGDFYMPQAYAVKLSEKIKLRTLDLLHLAYIKVMKERGFYVTTLLTADRDFKDHETGIEKEVKINVNLVE